MDFVVSNDTIDSSIFLKVGYDLFPNQGGQITKYELCTHLWGGVSRFRFWNCCCKTGGAVYGSSFVLFRAPLKNSIVFLRGRRFK